jgi:hypothetical protein
MDSAFDFHWMRDLISFISFWLDREHDKWVEFVTGSVLEELRK